MAGKKKTTNLKGRKKLDLKALKASDVLCPICRTIFIEPVTLPCQHAFCNACFKDTMENANLVCPLCRSRVGSWYRQIKKQNKLIDELFWSAIKDTFPQEVQNKYDGLDSGIEEDKPAVKVADQGEIRTEYEIERKKEENERKKLKEAEELASATLIKKLREEEEYRQAVEEEKIRLDAELARKIAQEMRPSTSKQKKTQRNSLGTLDKFFEAKNNKKSTANNFSTKEYTSGVMCLDKFPKTKQNGSKNLVMPVVQKKIQQIHRILETEDQTTSQPQDPSQANSGASSSANSNTSSSTKLDSRFYFKPIEIFKRSSVRKTLLGKLPIKVPGQRVNVSTEFIVSRAKAKLFSPKAMKPLEKTFPSAFASYSRSRKVNPAIRADVQTPQKSKKQSKIGSPKKAAVSINTEVRGEEKTVSKQSECKLVSEGSQNNNNLSFNSPKRHNIARRIFQKKNSTLASICGDDSPLLGFNEIKSSKVNCKPSSSMLSWTERSSSKIQKSNKREISKTPTLTKTNNLTHGESPISVNFAKTLLGWPRNRSAKVDNDVEFQSSKSQNTTKVINNAEFCTSVSSADTLLGWPKNRSAKVDSDAEFRSLKSQKSTKAKGNAECPIIVSSAEILLGWPKNRSAKVKSEAEFQSPKSQKSTKVKNNSRTSVCSAETLLGWPKNRSLVVESDAEFLSPKAQKSTKVKSNAECRTSVCSAEALFGWPKNESAKVDSNAEFQSPKSQKSNKTKIGNDFSSPSTFYGFHCDSSSPSDILKSTKSKSLKVDLQPPKLLKSKKSKNTTSASETETSIGFVSAPSLTHKSSKAKKSKLVHSPKTALSSLDDSVTETLFGFTSNSKMAKSRQGQNSKSDLKSTPDTSVSAASLNQSFLNQEPFLGFQTNQHSDIVEDNKEEEITKRLNNNSVSPEIDTSKIRQKRHAKRNGVVDNKPNGWSPIKKRKFDQIDNKMKKIQEESDLEYARKLQAEFNAIARPTRTRRGTQRQVTLDEMFSV